MAFLDGIWAWLMAALGPYSAIPSSTFFVLGISSVLALASTSANRLLVDIKKVRSATREISAWRKEFERAKKSNNKQLIAKLTKKQQAIVKLQSKMAMERMKVSMLFLIPFWAVWIVLSGFFGAQIVALSPFPIPFVGEELSFFYWYLISSFAVSLPLTRLLGINPEEG